MNQRSNFKPNAIKLLEENIIGKISNHKFGKNLKYTKTNILKKKKDKSDFTKTKHFCYLSPTYKWIKRQVMGLKKNIMDDSQNNYAELKKERLKRVHNLNHIYIYF